MEIKPLLPDTNVIIRALAGEEPEASLIKKAIEENRLVLSAVVIAEYLSKTVNEEEEKVFMGLVERFPVIPVDATVAQIAALYRKTYLSKKVKLVLPDCLIAASCKMARATLVTENRKDYPIKEIEILNIT